MKPLAKDFFNKKIRLQEHILGFCVILITLSGIFLRMLGKFQFMGWAYMSGSDFYLAIALGMLTTLLKLTATKNEHISRKELMKIFSKYCAVYFALILLFLVFVKYFVMK